jgi:hypothetical protein
MAEFLGDLERFAVDLYPYRWLVAAAVFGALGIVAGYGYQSGWHQIIWRHRVRVAIFGIPVLTVVIFFGYGLGSPLFTNKTVEKEFSFAFSATVPIGMEMGDVEEIMKGMAKMDQMMDEAIPAEATLEPVEVKSCSFKDRDKFHKGSGQARIYLGPDGSHVLRLENLDVTNGPELHVILSPHRDPDDRGDVKAPGYIDLGKLKGNRGNQNYKIPADVDVASQESVIIYCKHFHVIFSTAPLQDAS